MKIQHYYRKKSEVKDILIKKYFLFWFIIKILFLYKTPSMVM